MFCQKASRFVFLLFEFTIRAFAGLKWETRVLTLFFSLSFRLFVFCFDGVGIKVKVHERTNLYILNETCIQWPYLSNNTWINYYHAFSLRKTKNVWFCPRKKPSFKKITFWWIFLPNPGWMWLILLLITGTWSHPSSGIHWGDCTLLTVCS